jgi:pyruvate formate lyase activating enzyme
LDFLSNKIEKLDSLVITGGEPTLHTGLIPFMKKVKDLGFKVKLDTNGTHPDVLDKALENGLLDYIAMDVKSSPERYREIVNATVDLNDIKRSIDLIRRSDIDYEFRTTYIPGLVDLSHVEGIGKLIRGSKRYFVQNFRPSKCLDKTFNDRSSFDDDEIGHIAERIGSYSRSVRIR